MSIHKLSTADAFVVFDLDGAPATGVVRSAPKVLQGGAADMARSLTYGFATFGIARSGASAGINAEPDNRTAAVHAFVEELAPMVRDGRLSLDPAKGVEVAAMAALSKDDRSPVAAAVMGEGTVAQHLAALGPVVAAAAALRSSSALDGVSVAIEGFGESGPALAAEVHAAGGRIVAVSTTAGSTIDEAGMDPVELSHRWAQAGPRLVGENPAPTWKVLSVDADVVLAGSKMGAITHQGAANMGAKAVVAHSPLPYTARALATMQGRDVAVVADFVSTAGPIFAWYPQGVASPDAVIATATEAITDAVKQSLGHDEGAFMGACHRAEAYLRTWRDELPFGRPLAS